MTKEEYVLSTLAALLHFTSSSVGKLLCWAENPIAQKTSSLWKFAIMGPSYEFLKYWSSRVWGLGSGIQCFGKLGAAHQALLVPPPEWLMVFHPLAALGTCMTCWGSTAQPGARAFPCTCTSWPLKAAAIPRTLSYCLAREKSFFLYVKNVYFN